jgi:hypothetical protein
LGPHCEVASACEGQRTKRVTFGSRDVVEFNVDDEASLRWEVRHGPIKTDDLSERPTFRGSKGDARTAEPTAVAAPATEEPAPSAEEPQAEEAAAAATMEARTDEPAAEAEEAEEAPPAAVTAEVPAERTSHYRDLDDFGLDWARLAAGQIAAADQADQGGLSSLERQQVRRQVRSELGQRGAACDAAVRLALGLHASAATAGPAMAPAAEVVAAADQGGLSSLERQQVRRQVRSELGQRGAACDAAVGRALGLHACTAPPAGALPAAAAAPPSPLAPLLAVAAPLDLDGALPVPLALGLPFSLALKAAVEAYVLASPDIISLNTLRTEVAKRLGLPAGGLDACKVEIKALAGACVLARAAQARAAAVIALAPVGGDDID